jgi:hypothetical protein
VALSYPWLVLASVATAYGPNTRAAPPATSRLTGASRLCGGEAKELALAPVGSHGTQPVNTGAAMVFAAEATGDASFRNNYLKLSSVGTIT